jgi:GNAT superfamily N-acetyltransferase
MRGHRLDFRRCPNGEDVMEKRATHALNSHSAIASDVPVVARTADRDPALGDILLRAGAFTDLDAVNRVVDAAVMSWDLPDRVKRLSLPTYRYHAQDLEHLDLMLAEDPREGVVGAAAWESADPADAPEGRRALLLHGLYILPSCQRRGIGRALLSAAEETVDAAGFCGLLVRAQPSAAGFFAAHGFRHLQVRDPRRDYPHRFWKPRQSRRLIDRAYDPDQE